MESFVEFINGCGKMFIDSTGLMLIQSSVLIAILLGLDFILRRRFRAVFRYCVWMLILIKLVLPSSLSMPFSMGYWLGTAYDRVESYLPEITNPPHTPTMIANESSPESTGIVFDNPSRIIPATSEDTDSFSAPNVFQGTYSSEAGTTNDYVRATEVKTEATADSIVLLSPKKVELAGDGYVALTWQAAVFGLWLVVSMTMGLLVLQKTLLIQRIVRQAPLANKRLVVLFESCRKRILIGRAVTLRISPIIPTPAVYGLFRPTVLIPERMLLHDLGTNELEAIFIHELVHIQRCDLWVKLLQTILQVVYFYNPLLWLANATIRRVRELAVDEAVLVILGRSTSEIYPRTLLKVAGWVLDQPMHGLRLIGVMESNDLLTERIKIMLNKPIPRSKRIGTIGLAALFLLGAFLLPMASGQDAASNGEMMIAAVEESSASAAEVENTTASESAEVEAEIAVIEAEIGVESRRVEAVRAEIAKLQATIDVKLAELKIKERQLKAIRATLVDGLSPADRRAMRGRTIALAPPRNAVSSSAIRQPKKVAMVRSGYGDDMMGGGYGDGGVVIGRSRGGRRSLSSGGYGGKMGAVSGNRTVQAKKSSGGAPAMMGALTLAPVEKPVTSPIGPSQADISEEVKKELQRILPGLLREVLPKLLDEAMTGTRGQRGLYQDDYTSQTEPAPPEVKAPVAIPVEPTPIFRK